LRTTPLICAVIAIGAVPIGRSPMAEPAAPATSPEPPAASPSQPTALSGFDIVAPKKSTAVSGVEIVAKRATRVSEVVVSLPLCSEAKKTPETPDRAATGPATFRPRDITGDAPPPKVVSSFPAKGDVVRPGLLVLRVTFDKPMTCLGVLQNHKPFPDPCPPPLRAPMISHDKRTFLTVCKIDAGRQYGLWLNGFTSVKGAAMPPYELVFDASDRADIATVEEAVAQDKWLRKVSNPGS
jgi:hypothetical protein